MRVIQRGAEAVLRADTKNSQKVVIKDRIRKGYRLPVLDKKIRKQRTKREKALLNRARRYGVNTPIIIDSKENVIVLERIEGQQIKSTLNNMEKGKRELVYRLIGESLAKLHAGGIVHGDITTSNMILKEDKLYIIDFGLGKTSKKVEDQAADLYLLYEAIRSAHFQYLNEAWDSILNAYKQKYSNSNIVFKQLEKIRIRRRYK